MKSFNISIVFFSLILPGFYLGIYAQNQEISDKPGAKTVYGEGFASGEVMTGSELLELYNGLENREAIEVQYKGIVSSVCQVKGCWMTVELANGQEARVTFKDYGFFVPVDLAGKEVVVSGMAQVDVISEEDRKHYAEDAGKSATEVRNIRGNLKSYSLVANGVIIED